MASHPSYRLMWSRPISPGDVVSKLATKRQTPLHLRRTTSNPLQIQLSRSVLRAHPRFHWRECLQIWLYPKKTSPNGLSVSVEPSELKRAQEAQIREVCIGCISLRKLSYLWWAGRKKANWWWRRWGGCRRKLYKVWGWAWGTYVSKLFFLSIFKNGVLLIIS